MIHGTISFTHNKVKLLGEGFTYVVVLASDTDRIISRHASYKLAKRGCGPGCVIRSLGGNEYAL
jgi:hypothetical protein